jgi:hypothetical protein
MPTAFASLKQWHCQRAQVKKLPPTIRHEGKMCVLLFCSVDLHSTHLLYQSNETLCFRTQN